MRNTALLALCIVPMIAAPAIAAPLTLHCSIKGSAARVYGRLKVTVDIDARFVAVEAARMPGLRWEYRDGVLAPHLAKGPDSLIPYYPPVRQFVTITATSINVGWHDATGDIKGQLGSFNRSAIDMPGTACIWHPSAPLAWS